MDNKVYWNHNNTNKISWDIEKKGSDILPSSSILREEIQLIAESKIDEADKLVNKDFR